MAKMRISRGVRAVGLTLAVQLMATGALAEDPQGPSVAGPTSNSAGPAFDRAFSPAAPAEIAGAGLAGKVVDRFAPPVAAPIDTRSPGQPLAQTSGPLLRPCDTPGSGCRNPSPVTRQVVVPPIVPGTRPPRANP